MKFGHLKEAVYEVKADLATGQWNGMPYRTQERATKQEWFGQKYTEDIHYDGYVHFPTDADGQQSILGESRLLRILWS